MEDRQKVVPLYPRTKGNPITSRLAAKILDELGVDPAVPDLPHEILEALSKGLADPNPLCRLEAVESVYALAYHVYQALLRATRNEAEIVRILANSKVERIQSVFGSSDNKEDDQKKGLDAE